VIKRLGVLVGGTVAFWALVTYPARLLWDDSSFLFSTTAAVLCLLPASLTLVWAGWALKGQPEQQLLAVLGGTGVRMLFVVGSGLVLFLNVEAFQYQRFWIFLVVYYLVTLALEVVALTWGTAAQPQRN
jgi:hypothetical protein